MKFLILLCTLPLLAVAKPYNDVAEIFNSATVAPYTCAKAGSFCSNKQEQCSNIFLCTPAGNNQWTMIESQCDTSKGETCNAGKCSITPAPLCYNTNNKEFKCESREGIYPDPFDCKKFHYCLPKTEVKNTTPTQFNPSSLVKVDEGNYTELYEVIEKPVTSYCPDEYYYNPLSTYCDRRLTNGNCPITPEIPLCKTHLQTGAVRTNRVLYYICLPYDKTDRTLYPHLYQCHNGKKYQNNFNCV